jgi:hypothetical protein
VARAVVDTPASLAEAGGGPPRGARRERWSVHGPAAGRSESRPPPVGRYFRRAERAGAARRTWAASDPTRDRGSCCVWLAGCGEEVVADLLAAAAGSGVDATVVVVLGVPVTLLAAGATGRRAGLDRCAEDANIGRGLAGDDAARSCAGISAIEVKANSADQLLHVLAEAGVGAAGAGGGTVDTLVDAAHQPVAIGARPLRMRLDHLLNCHFVPLRARAWPR